MTRAFPVVPGVPAAGHVTGGGAWHPGRAEGCVKCAPRPRPGDQCGDDCTVDCGHCKGSPERRAVLRRRAR